MMIALLTATALAGCTAATGEPGPESATASASASPASSRSVVVQTREIGDIRRVVLETPGELTIILGTVPALTVTAEEAVIDALSTATNGDSLSLGTERPVVTAGSPGIRYALTVTSLTAVTVRGSGTVSAEFGRAARASIAVSGSSSVTARVHAETLDTELFGSGRVTVTGIAAAQTLRISGSGVFSGGSLHSAETTVSVRGPGVATVRATATIDATVVGSGSIRHTGGATVTRRIDGAGSISGH